MPFAKWSHYEDAIWVVPLFGWLRMLPPSSPHHNNDYNSKYLLSSYCVLNTVQRTFQGLPHFQQFSEILTTIHYELLYTVEGHTCTKLQISDTDMHRDML